MSWRIQVRKDTASNWQTINPTLAEGEFGYETDTGRLKIGDGSTPWNDLPYFAVSGSNVVVKKAEETSWTNNETKTFTLYTASGFEISSIELYERVSREVRVTEEFSIEKDGQTAYITANRDYTNPVVIYITYVYIGETDAPV